MTDPTEEFYLSRVDLEGYGSPEEETESPKIVTVCVCPPIPVRTSDWQAYREGSIDVCADPDCHCREHMVIGWGTTEQEAIDDLLRQEQENAA